MYNGLGACDAWRILCTTRLSFGPEAETPALRLKYGHESWNLGLVAKIWALRLKYGSQGLDFGLEARIMAS